MNVTFLINFSFSKIYKSFKLSINSSFLKKTQKKIYENEHNIKTSRQKRIEYKI